MSTWAFCVTQDYYTPRQQQKEIEKYRNKRGESVMERISVQQYAGELFYKMPQFLFEEHYKKMSNDAKVMYMLMKNRFNLSMQNGWVDNEGHIYLIFTRDELVELMNKSLKTVTKIKKELIEAGLIEQVQQGMNKPNLYYLTQPTLEPQGRVKITLHEGENLPFKKGKNYPQERKSFINKDFKKDFDDDDNNSARKKFYIDSKEYKALETELETYNFDDIEEILLRLANEHVAPFYLKKPIIEASIKNYISGVEYMGGSPSHIAGFFLKQVKKAVNDYKVKNAAYRKRIEKLEAEQAERTERKVPFYNWLEV